MTEKLINYFALEKLGKRMNSMRWVTETSEKLNNYVQLVSLLIIRLVPLATVGTAVETKVCLKLGNIEKNKEWRVKSIRQKSIAIKFNLGACPMAVQLRPNFHFKPDATVSTERCIIFYFHPNLFNPFQDEFHTFSIYWMPLGRLLHPQQRNPIEQMNDLRMSVSMFRFNK